MPTSATSSRSSRARLAGALLAFSLFAAGCSGGESPAPEDPPAASDGGGSASDGGSVSDGGSEAPDGGGQTEAAIPVEAYPVTPAPDGFEPPAACNGEGTYLAEVGTAATPELPERAGESVTIELTGIEGDDAQLTAAVGDGEPRPVEDIALGETVTIDLWTIAVTSVCSDTEQVEFDLID
ncbi:hypothetical protein ACFQRD_09865 [Brachybacterium sp. GCM10030268]|uniref:hypothetical protein n=1 Tax=Brachybacterium sp. GCM10030268 TaxID=3273382 RepID=UPI00361ECB24